MNGSAAKPVNTDINNNTIPFFVIPLKRYHNEPRKNAAQLHPPSFITPPLYVTLRVTGGKGYQKLNRKRIISRPLQP